MDTFPITSGLVETKYPESAVRVNFGNSWTFTAPGVAPDQRIFTITLTGMKYYQNSDGTPDTTTRANLNNLWVLEAFYRSVKTVDEFLYNHPMLGTLVCRFSSPLTIPKGIPNGLGMVEDMTVVLIEVPQ